MTSLVSFAHAFETVLDLMRSKKLATGPKVIPTLFRAFDVLSDMVASARDGGPDPAQLQALQMDLDRLADCSPADHAQTADEDYSFDFQPIQIDILPSTGSQASAEGGEKRFRISLGPTGDLYAKGHEPAAFLRSLSMLGKMHVEADIGSVTSLEELDLAQPHLLWKVDLQTTAEKDEIEAIFDFIDDMAVISVNEMHDTNHVQNESSNSTPDPVQRETEVQDSLHQIDTAKEPSAAILPFSTTIRVNLDRVDRLINQIGELVIMEAMLSQVVSSAGLRDDTDITSSLDGIKQLAANIQESVMSIRAQPIKPVFQRMQRIVREASDLTGKEVHLHMLGEATEG